MTIPVRAKRTIAVAIAAALTTGCSDSSDEHGAPAEERPSQHVTTENPDLGTYARLTDGLDVTVEAMTAGDDGDDARPWLIVDVRLANGTGTTSSIPDLGMVCSESNRRGVVNRTSTLVVGQPVPAGEALEGQFYLRPPDNGYERAVPECKGPAFVSIGDQNDPNGIVVQFRIPSAELTALNAIARETFDGLELPPPTTDSPSAPTTATTS